MKVNGWVVVIDTHNYNFYTELPSIDTDCIVYPFSLEVPEIKNPLIANVEVSAEKQYFAYTYYNKYMQVVTYKGIIVFEKLSQVRDHLNGHCIDKDKFPIHKIKLPKPFNECTDGISWKKLITDATFVKELPRRKKVYKAYTYTIMDNKRNSDRDYSNYIVFKTEKDLREAVKDEVDPSDVNELQVIKLKKPFSKCTKVDDDNDIILTTTATLLKTLPFNSK